MQLLPEPEAHGRRGYNHAMARSRLLLGALLVACALFAVWQDAAVGQGRAPVTAVASPDGKLVLSSLGSAVPKLTDPTIGATRPCGFRHSGVSYDHVMWVFMENESLSSIIGAPDAPFANLLARRCGLATDYYAVGHPSLLQLSRRHRWHDGRGERRRRARGPPRLRAVDLLPGRLPPPDMAVVRGVDAC